MSHDDTPLLPHGGYKKLRSYVVAEAVYDATVVFCRRFYARDWRMTDQMVQAARSGVRNISEGSGAAATSRKSEMKLTNVAGRASVMSCYRTTRVSCDRTGCGCGPRIPGKRWRCGRGSGRIVRGTCPRSERVSCA